jgi:hypothetical protein
MRKASLFTGCRFVGPDWYWNMDWHRNIEFDQRACRFFDCRSIRYDGDR